MIKRAIIALNYFPYKEPITLTNDKRKALALSVILAEINNSYHEKLEVDELNENSLKKWKQALSRDWGIENKDDLLETLNWLAEEGHSKYYLELLEIIKNKEQKNISEMAVLNKYEDGKTGRLFWVENMKNVVNNRSLKALSPYLL